MVDFAEFESWPLVRRRSFTSASNGLLNGDLAPLAAHVRAGWPIDKTLAGQIADAIEGPDKEGFVLRMVGKRGGLRFEDREHRWRLMGDVALYVLVREQKARDAGLSGSRKGIIQDAEKEFGLSRSTIEKMLADFRKWAGAVADTPMSDEEVALWLNLTDD